MLESKAACFIHDSLLVGLRAVGCRAYLVIVSRNTWLQNGALHQNVWIPSAPLLLACAGGSTPAHVGQGSKPSAFLHHRQL